MKGVQQRRLSDDCEKEWRRRKIGLNQCQAGLPCTAADGLNERKRILSFFSPQEFVSIGETYSSG